MLRNNLFFLESLFIALFTIFFFSCDVNSPHNDLEKPVDVQPKWSPDGKKILYGKIMENNEFGIFQLDTTSKISSRVSLPNGAYYPDWSPDGKWIAYQYGGNIYKRKMEGDSIIVQLTFEGNNYFPSWSSDGEWIAYDSNAESPNGMHFIWKVKWDGSQRKRIIYTPTIGEVRKADWFPDGIKLAVSRYILGTGDDPEIAIIDTMGNSISIITSNDNFDLTPKVSPDGNHITFYSYGNGGLLYVARTDGSDLRLINAGHSIDPDWSPDGKKIIYAITLGGGIWIMNKDGSEKKRITY